MRRTEASLRRTEHAGSEFIQSVPKPDTRFEHERRFSSFNSPCVDKIRVSFVITFYRLTTLEQSNNLIRKHLYPARSMIMSSLPRTKALRKL